MTSSPNPNLSSSRRLVTAFFDSRGEAEDAIESLVEAGVSRDSIRFMPGDERDPSDTAGTSVGPSPAASGIRWAIGFCRTRIAAPMPKVCAAAATCFRSMPAIASMRP